MATVRCRKEIRYASESYVINLVLFTRELKGKTA